MIGVVSFLSTVVFFGPTLLLLLLPFCFYLFFRNGVSRAHFSGVGGIGFLLICIAAFIAVLFFLLFEAQYENFDKSIVGAFPYILMVVASIVIGLTVSYRDLKIVLYLIVLEVIVGLAEYIVGVPSFFNVQARGLTDFGSTELLYYNRVYGLSYTPSIYAFKVLVGVVLLNAFLMNETISRRVYYCLMALMVAGLLVSFSRTTIVSVAVGLMVLHVKNWRWGLAALMLALAGFVFYYDVVLQQFTRGSGEVDLSGRDFIFPIYVEVIEDFPLIGNAASKLWLDVGGRIYHAHNSYLQLFASNGILISLLFCFGYYLFVLRGRLVLALPILIYSTFQYGLFWGLSFHDIIFCAIMMWSTSHHLPDRDL